MNEPIEYHTLSNGMKVVNFRRKGAVEYCGVAVNAGSRDELTPSRHGLAHFTEHTIFKGTKRRRAWHILNRMEAVGGELNAYTTKEETFIYSTFPKGNLRRAADLIADLIKGSVFPEAEINREREVVADEINSYLDVPSEGIFDDFEDLIFAGSPLGHNILGTVESIAGFTPEVCRQYLDEYYTPGEMVFFHSGPQSAESVMTVAERCFGNLRQPDIPRQRKMPGEVERFDVTREIHSHQAHVVMGARVGGMCDPDRHAMALLTNTLGGPGMNSLLNVELRERRGLVYSIDASTSLMTDTGLMTIYFGCDPDDADRCRRLVERTVDRLASDGITPRRLDRIKKQYTGQLIIASTNAEQATLSMGRSMLYYGTASTVEQTISRFNEITPERLRTAAERLTALSTLTLH